MMIPPGSTSVQTSEMPPAYDISTESQLPPATQSHNTMNEKTPNFVDWFDFTRNRSARFIAEKTCEMICYLWFQKRPSLQLVPSPAFVSFTQKVLETTQVSQSVIVLSL